jgi:hypothetical protein
VCPDVPQRQVLGGLVTLLAIVDEPVLRCIGTEIAILQLRGDQISDCRIELRLQSRVASVGPRVRGRIDEFPDVLADPRVLAGALAVALEDHVGVDARQQALAQIDRHPIAQHAADGLLVERRRDEPRFDAGRDYRAHPNAAIAGAEYRRQHGEPYCEQRELDLHVVM